VAHRFISNLRLLISLFDFNGLRHALPGGLPDKIVVLLRDLVKLDYGQKLVFIVLEDFWTKLITVAVTHALAVDVHLHQNLLWLYGRLM
jgi:hypothetical protein